MVCGTCVKIQPHVFLFCFFQQFDIYRFQFVDDNIMYFTDIGIFCVEHLPNDKTVSQTQESDANRVMKKQHAFKIEILSITYLILNSEMIV